MSQKFTVKKHPSPIGPGLFSKTDLICETWSEAFDHVYAAFGFKTARGLTHWHPSNKCIAFSNGNFEDPFYIIHWD